MRKRVKGKPDPDVYTLKVECLSELEKLAKAGHIDLYYGDVTGVSERGYVPYAWQFNDEQVCLPVCRGKTLNCFGLVQRNNTAYFATTTEKITANYILAELDQFSFTIDKPTVVVLEPKEIRHNARVHTARKIKERLLMRIDNPHWQRRGLWVFYLPMCGRGFRYSPHLNIAEIVWRFLKYYWLKPEDYQSKDTLFYAVKTGLSQFWYRVKDRIWCI